MRKTMIAIAAALTVILGGSPATANAEPSRTLGVEMGSGQHTVTREVTFKTSPEDRQRTLNYLRKVRSDMWDKNVPITGTPLQELQPNKKEYVEALEISGDLERIAYQRAFESHYVGLKHQRPDGADVWNAETTAGVRSWGENLCVNATVEGCLEMLTYGEEANLRARNGFYANDTGHLLNFIRPENKYVGFGMIGKYGSTQHSPYPDSSRPAYLTGNQTLSMAVPNPSLVPDNVGSALGWDGRVAGAPSTGDTGEGLIGFDLGKLTFPIPIGGEGSSGSSGLSTEAQAAIGVIAAIVALALPLLNWLANSGLLPF